MTETRKNVFVRCVERWIRSRGVRATTVASAYRSNTNDTAKNREHEWVPLQCRKKMTVKELDAASRHSACDARQVGKGVKHAVRPRQPER